ncbi:hypothetical protein C9933_01270 [Methylophaga nitratireducenticrescens]|nr:hypothetical protein C9933_01270 [Methylophaga nitratireducenticrescens]
MGTGPLTGLLTTETQRAQIPKAYLESPFVLPEKMVISGLEIEMFERSEFFRFPCDGHFFRGAAGQHKGCLFFWFIFFGHAKKMNSPSGEI